MTDTNDTSAAGLFTEFADGTKLHLRPLTDEDMDLLTQWCQAKMINMAEASLPSPCAQEVYDRRMAVAIREASKITWMSAQGAAMLRNIDGLVHLCWLAARKDKPDITEAYIKKQLTSVENARRFNADWRRVNNLGDKKGVSSPVPKTKESPSPLELESLPKARSTRSSRSRTTGRRR